MTPAARLSKLEQSGAAARDFWLSLDEEYRSSIFKLITEGHRSPIDTMSHAITCDVLKGRFGDDSITYLVLYFATVGLNALLLTEAERELSEGGCD